MTIFQKYSRCILVIIAFQIASSGFQKLEAQTYGLGFGGQDVTLDKRTELNLSPDKYLKFEDEFEISFDLSLNSNLRQVYGYVFRIIDQDNYNIDLVNLSKADGTSTQLNVVNGKNESVLSHELSVNTAADWGNLRVKFLLSEDRMVFYTSDTFYVQDNMQFKRKNGYKIIFGANDFKQFKTTDVPSMKIKDVKIYEKGKLQYYWPLDELNQDMAIDRIRDREAVVKNPLWLKPMHQEWQLGLDQKVNGFAQVAADLQKGNIFLIGQDELLIYSVQDNERRKVAYKNKPQFLLAGGQAVFNNLDNKIYTYDVDEKAHYSLNIETGEWSSKETLRMYETEFLHHNKFFNEKENTIHIFGGYGQHQYKNKIHKLNLNEKSWEEIETETDIYKPRYMAGMGLGEDTVYILGGYGSQSGNQMLNPHNYYDLLSYSLDSNQLEYKFEIPRILDDMCVANSMFIDQSSRSFHALIYEKVRYDGYLQLIRGSLDKPEAVQVGNRIPYLFHDTKSYADLFYFPEVQKLYAFTSIYTDSQETSVQLYSINYPPNEIKEVQEADVPSGNVKYYLIGLLLILILGASRFMFMKRKTKEESTVPVIPVEEKESVRVEKEYVESELHVIEEKINYHLIFFGGFQVFNAEDKDITNKFTPLLKELFLLIWFYSFKNNKGISSAKLTEHLWYDKSEKSARNNRAVNIAKLRTILNELGACELTHKTGYWKIVLNEADIKSDYIDFLQLTGSKTNLSKQKINRLIEITQKGAILMNVSYEWLDDFKASVSDKIIDTLVAFSESCDVKKDADFVIHLADCLFNFDMINEDALNLKCRAQYSQGKHSLANKTYEKFIKEYKQLYDEDYGMSFLDVVNGQN